MILQANGEGKANIGGTEYYYADFTHGSGKDFEFHMGDHDLTQFAKFYEPVEIDGTSHCEEMVVSEPFMFKTASFKGGFNIHVCAMLEICVFGWFPAIQAVSFEFEEDAALFRTVKPVANIVNTTKFVTQLHYTRSEANAALETIEAAKVGGAISPRSAAAYKAHISRRVAA